MAKSVELRVRMGGRWHDWAVLNNALETLARGKPLTRAGTWLLVAAAIDEALLEAAGGEQVTSATVASVELTDGQARRLWAELLQLPVESFGRTPAGQLQPVPLAPLVAMLREMAAALKEELPAAWLDDTEGGE